MGIETRRNGQYYYRKVRHNGKVRSVYLGSGAMALALDRTAQRMQAERADEQAARRAIRAAEQATDRTACQIAAAAREIAALVLLGTGHHRHGGVWRLRRRTIQMSEPLIKQAERDAPKLSLAEAKALMRRCDVVDAAPEDLARLRALLRVRSANHTETGSLIRNALDRVLHELPATALVRELSADHIERRRCELGYFEAPALERPLIDHLLLCEARMGLVEQHYSAMLQGSISLDVARYWEHRLSATQQRYLRAVETLARIRRVRVELLRITSSDGTEARAMAVERPGD